MPQTPSDVEDSLSSVSPQDGWTPASQPAWRAWVARHSAALLSLPALLWLLIFFIAPLLIIVGMSVMTRGAGGVPQLPLTLEHYDRTFNTFGSILNRSLWVAFWTTLACLLLAYPMAVFIRTRQKPWMRSLALFLVILPFWTNFLVRTYAWRMLLGNGGIINSLLARLGLTQHGLQLLNTELAVMIGLVYGFLPFMVLPIYASVERFDFKYVEAAADLGANYWHTFWRVMLPMTLPGVLAGCVLVFVPSIGAFVTPDLLGGRSGLMIGNLINSQFKGTGNMPLGAAMSVVLLAFVLLPLAAYMRINREER